MNDDKSQTFSNSLGFIEESARESDVPTLHRQSTAATTTTMSPNSKPKRKPPKQEFTPTTAAATTPNATPSDFSFAIARIAVSQISQSVGFRAAQPSAVEALTRVATKYIEAVASASAAFAAAAGRTDANVFDLANALHDLQSAQGFKGGSRLHERGFCVLGSSLLSDLSKFVRWNDEIPFARPIPRRRSRISIPRRELDSPGDLDSGFRSSIVPRWLPEFPDLKKSVAKRKNGEELWEDSCAGGGGGGDGGRNERESGEGKYVGLELGVKSSKVGRVRFRIGGGAAAEEKAVAAGGLGVNLKSGVCRGGKRVCWGKNKIGDNFNTRIHELELGDNDDKL